MRFRSTQTLVAFAAFALSTALYAEDLLNSADFPQMLSSSSTFASDEEAATAQAELWKRYVEKAQGDSQRLAQHNQRVLKYGDKAMRFSLEKRGNAPSTGYPVYIALHGGGGAPPFVNDSQWEHMKVYYRDSVDTGIYIAPRGVTDTWNLHFVDESYPLYDRLIENLIAYEGADPNRIYLLGFSAGGDGVYQVVPRMANRFAAANMSAGHHNWVAFDNLFNTPFLIQVGEYDSAYNRNKVAAQNYVMLSTLQEKHKGYVHEAFIHPDRGHNGWADNDSSPNHHSVMKDPKAWLEKGDRSTINTDTNAVRWLKQHVRPARPERIIWDIGTRANRTTTWGADYAGAATKLTAQKDLFYWLALDAEPQNNARIEAEHIRGTNRVDISLAQGVSSFRILLNAQDYDFTRPVQVYYKGLLLLEVQPQHKLQVMARTVLESGDRNLLFDDEILVKIPANKLEAERDADVFSYCSNGRCTLMTAEDFKRARNFPVSMHYHCKKPNQYALTFDDGPTGEMNELLATLAAHQVPATFFVVGSKLESEEGKANLRAAHQAGHQIANHTYTHGDLTTMEDERIRNEVVATRKAILEVIGDTPATRLGTSIVRPPFGNINQQVQWVLDENGFDSVRWNSDRYDWQLGDGKAQVIAQRIDQHLELIASVSQRSTFQPSILDLNHEFSSSTREALNTAIPKLKTAGYTFVTVSECIGATSN